MQEYFKWVDAKADLNNQIPGFVWKSRDDAERYLDEVRSWIHFSDDRPILVKFIGVSPTSIPVFLTCSFVLKIKGIETVETGGQKISHERVAEILNGLSSEPDDLFTYARGSEWLQPLKDVAITVGCIAFTGDETRYHHSGIEAFYAWPVDFKVC